MLEVFLGPFHPELEEALVKKVSDLKQVDPLCPIALIAPSHRLCWRLKTLLVAEKGLSLINTYFLDFYQLAIRIYQDEQGIPDQLIQDELFFEDFIRHCLKSYFPPDNPLRALTDTAGGSAALRATLRDLNDADIDIATILEALKEGFLEGEDSSRTLGAIFELYEKMAISQNNLEFMEVSDLTRLATHMVPGAKFLEKLHHILYYGFYDLTQLQLDFFRAIASHYPTTLFFPLREGHPAFLFAELFFKRYIHGIISDSKALVKLPKSPQPNCLDSVLDRFFVDHPEEAPPALAACKIITASGAEDEVLTVAKEVCRLVEEGYMFRQIGVTARGLEGYVPLIARIFRAHNIPFCSSAEEPVSLYPMTKAINFLCLLITDDYYRPYLIELVSSPYFKGEDFCPPGIKPRPDYWDILSRRLSITKGMEEWRSLERFLQSGIEFREGENGEEEHWNLTALEVQGLWNIVYSLEKDFSALPATAPWHSYVDSFRVIIDRYLDLPGFQREIGQELEPEIEVGKRLTAALDSLRQRDLFTPSVSLEVFITALQQTLERASIKLGAENIAGVQVLDAMAARGIPFKILFIIGLNEKVFPRYIQEDALLRDSARRTLEAGLGYKIPEKMLGYEEEKLLFYLLLNAASDRVYCLYQRSDQSGRPLVPSWYLDELGRTLWGRRIAVGTMKAVEEAIPRQWLDKHKTSPYYQTSLLTPKELAMLLLLQDKEVLPLLQELDMAPGLLLHGRETLMILEKARQELTSRDGWTGPLAGYWDTITQKGPSPTALELYAQCPFRYFAQQALQLKPLERPETILGLEPAEEGQLYHQVLCLFYNRLAQFQYFQTDKGKIDIYQILEQVTNETFQQFAQGHPIRYPVLWEVWQEGARDTLQRLIEKDLGSLAESGFVPTYFEIEAQAGFPGSGQEILSGLAMHGRLDRIDLKKQNSTILFRIIDYKFKAGTSPKKEDRDLTEAAIRAQRLQPPIYLLLGSDYLREGQKGHQPRPESVIFQFIAPGWPNDPLATSEFPGDCWTSPLGDQIAQNIALLLKGIKAGLFFIIPDDQGYCRYCDFSTICRKNHPPSRWRAERDPHTRPYHSLRTLKLPKKEK